MFFYIISLRCLLVNHSLFVVTLLRSCGLINRDDTVNPTYIVLAVAVKLLTIILPGYL